MFDNDGTLWAEKPLYFQFLFAIDRVRAFWGATEWTAWRLGFQPQLGPPWFTIADVPIYLPSPAPNSPCSKMIPTMTPSAPRR